VLEKTEGVTNMIYSDLFKGGIAGFILGLLTCMAILLLWGSVSSPFFKTVPDVSSTNAIDTRVTLLEHQVGRINERLSDVRITAMRDEVILQKVDINALKNRLYKIEFEWGK
jgi:hypothetical protein